MDIWTPLDTAPQPSTPIDGRCLVQHHQSTTFEKSSNNNHPVSHRATDLLETLLTWCSDSGPDCPRKRLGPTPPSTSNRSQPLKTDGGGNTPKATTGCNLPNSPPRMLPAVSVLPPQEDLLHRFADLALWQNASFAHSQGADDEALLLFSVRGRTDGSGPTGGAELERGRRASERACRGLIRFRSRTGVRRVAWGTRGARLPESLGAGRVSVQTSRLRFNLALVHHRLKPTTPALSLPHVPSPSSTPTKYFSALLTFLIASIHHGAGKYVLAAVGFDETARLMEGAQTIAYADLAWSLQRSEVLFNLAVSLSKSGKKDRADGVLAEGMKYMLTSAQKTAYGRAMVRGIEVSFRRERECVWECGNTREIEISELRLLMGS
ncbi:hypothetical protein BDK51DRAFT_47683 [Blyttiomyces helicus]|uniref:Uncharacterized protein n=1 Tax=Blyttiomyces helicus TaxID=388810 RepID=A0A4P9W4D7_9FUNG|nr:hypothetical protein BDK51DRAFT_47683 [Blyttiomyces helicus]|eukprot:RKO85718.1 hypothetical protein BDK51DRAFT_47683 [Blyttiomyces helicus]